MRTLAAVAVFLCGTTFLWMTPAMNGDDGSSSGAAWNLVQVLAWLAVVGYAAAGWSIIRTLDWWSSAATGAAVAGLATTAAFLMATQGSDGVPNVAANAGLHAAVSLAMLAVVVLPPARAWMVRRVDR